MQNIGTIPSLLTSLLPAKRILMRLQSNATVWVMGLKRYLPINPKGIRSNSTESVSDTISILVG